MTYEKPRLMALSLGGNDRLCGDCAGHTTLKDAPGTAGLILELVGINPDSNGVAGIDKGDFSQVFSTVEACKKPVETYCKFTSATTVAWS